MAHPSANTEALLDILQETGAHDKVVAMKAANISALASKPLQELVHDCWSLDVLAAKYTDFIELFRPVLRTLRAAGSLDPEQCFLVQTLLMHDFRRALLHDPQLPSQLLPANWSGGIARQLCEDIYRITCPHAQQHLARLAALALPGIEGDPVEPRAVAGLAAEPLAVAVGQQQRLLRHVPRVLLAHDATGDGAHEPSI